MADKLAFTRKYLPAVVSVSTIYSMSAALFYFANVYGRQVVSYAYGADDAPPWFYATRSLPGAITSFVLLVAYCYIGSSRLALRAQLLSLIGGSAIAGLSTLLYRQGAITGVAWLYTYFLGVGMLSAIGGTPIWDRMVAMVSVELQHRGGTVAYLCAIQLVFANVGHFTIYMIALLSKDDASDEEAVSLLITATYFLLPATAALSAGTMVYFDVLARRTSPAAGCGKDGVLPNDDLPLLAPAAASEEPRTEPTTEQHEADSA
jgi:hypothetical protein